MPDLERHARVTLDRTCTLTWDRRIAVIPGVYIPHQTSRQAAENLCFKIIFPDPVDEVQHLAVQESTIENADAVTTSGRAIYFVVHELTDALANGEIVVTIESKVEKFEFTLERARNLTEVIDSIDSQCRNYSELTEKSALAIQDDDSDEEELERLRSAMSDHAFLWRSRIENAVEDALTDDAERLQFEERAEQLPLILVPGNTSET